MTAVPQRTARSHAFGALCVTLVGLMETDDANGDSAQTDVALVIGANDVTNPAARTDASSPIYGMPILDADKSRTVMVIKRGIERGVRRHR
jgi:NAD/NADP transhydrogenase beta subunit